VEVKRVTAIYIYSSDVVYTDRDKITFIMNHSGTLKYQVIAIFVLKVEFMTCVILK
jgi:hypothetical protein